MVFWFFSILHCKPRKHAPFSAERFKQVSATPAHKMNTWQQYLTRLPREWERRQCSEPWFAGHLATRYSVVQSCAVNENPCTSSLSSVWMYLKRKHEKCRLSECEKKSVRQLSEKICNLKVINNAVINTLVFCVHQQKQHIVAHTQKKIFVFK